MTLEDLERDARFVAKNAKHNLKLVKQQAEVIDPAKLASNIKWLEMMIALHQKDLAAAKVQMKKARLTGRTSLRTRLKYLVASILRDERSKGKGDAA
ncbi:MULTISPECIES: hypothetical protein [unclassified Paenibacillus]|uniref:hypothetical protein n=1 Tax=unclassified Paenibacillus TaxID=185978 RepID=UPI002476AD04|nr:MULTISPECIES: hypothetical protein [unclassified Paenibacillus]MDH6427224.1 hypothetical protein [Paenibacillus sp. PastH-4]MDH6443253.1 hypothetical protein [Paenibacillus sp. PastF-4]MDH6526042.1 hypothetical protein [Paenibacillus sp. PastH-3]